MPWFCVCSGGARNASYPADPPRSRAGITLSPLQVERATALTAKAGLSSKVSFQARRPGHTQHFSRRNHTHPRSLSEPSCARFCDQVADALNMPFKDASFDLVWSLESGEHMPEKKKARPSLLLRGVEAASHLPSLARQQLRVSVRLTCVRGTMPADFPCPCPCPQFMSEMMRVAAPGGKIILVTWCHRPLKAGEALAPSEQARGSKRGERGGLGLRVVCHLRI